ncbi:unnamed protein product [Ambrosiozyma monospora]|uniref:Unnamed protein product n=1 Tax=Ambrosiozyma monospora TaxID=43982 RepID=A0A9W6T0F0_AMBMO|nr:unnamed protein product [Ambrosiozyma monospora]
MTGNRNQRQLRFPSLAHQLESWFPTSNSLRSRRHACTCHIHYIGHGGPIDALVIPDQRFDLDCDTLHLERGTSSLSSKSCISNFTQISQIDDIINSNSHNDERNQDNDSKLRSDHKLWVDV